MTADRVSSPSGTAVPDHHLRAIARPRVGQEGTDVVARD